MGIHFGGKIFSIIYNTAEDMETSVVIHVAGNALGSTILVKTIGERTWYDRSAFLLAVLANHRKALRRHRRPISEMV
jgi:hypothetical protein